MEDDETKGEEVVDQTDKTNKNKAARQQLEKLNEYVQKMAYKPIDPLPASQRTETLSKPPKKYILGTYTEHKNNFKPKERSNRIKTIIQKHQPITIEKLEEIIRKHRKKQAQYEKAKKQQKIKYHETLLKLQTKCENQLMNAIVHKFAEIISKKACLRIISPSNVETESFQRLQNELVCKMIFDLKVPNEQLSKDITVYKKLAAVLADLILQALFLAHNYDEQSLGDDQEQHIPKANCVKGISLLS